MAAGTRPLETPGNAPSSPAVASRHRAPGRARVDVLRIVEVGGLSTAIVCSVVAVLLTVGGQRPAAVAVAAVGLVLAVVALLAGRVQRPVPPAGRRRMPSGR